MATHPAQDLVFFTILIPPGPNENIFVSPATAIVHLPVASSALITSPGTSVQLSVRTTFHRRFSSLLRAPSIFLTTTHTSQQEASVLSELARVPKSDQVAPPLLLLQNWLTPLKPEVELLKVPATIWVVLVGLTARLGSEFWSLSPLWETGMTSVTVMTAARAAGGAAKSAITAVAHTPDSNSDGRLPAPHLDKLTD